MNFEDSQNVWSRPRHAPNGLATGRRGYGTGVAFAPKLVGVAFAPKPSGSKLF